MFYKKGIDITNDKQMFEFLKNHYTYWTMNSWNGLKSIANNVKLYNLKLDGDWCDVLQALEEDEYYSINFLLTLFERKHNGYEVGFNGRSGGYLVLCNTENNSTILPYAIEYNDNYEEYKQYCKDYYGGVKYNRSTLREYVKLVQDFDKLCDELRDYCNNLAKYLIKAA